MKTITIKKSFTEVKEIEKEISIPYYSKSDSSGTATYYRIVNDKCVMSIYAVTSGVPYASISVSEYRMIDALKATPCTEHEFTGAYNTAQAIIESQFHEEVETVDETPEETINN